MKNNDLKNVLSFDSLPQKVSDHDREILELRNEIQQLKESRTNHKIMYSPNDVESEFGIPKATVYLLRHQGKLSGIKKGKRLFFTQEDILSYLESGRFEKIA